MRTYGKGLGIISACVVGGVSERPQKQALKRGLDVLVATPGRLLDLADQKAVRFDEIETLVLDEADQMLDIGFLPAIKRVIAACPKTRQTLLFSATMPREIRALSASHLHNPAEVSVAPVSKTADKIEQGVMHLTSDDKVAAITALVRGEKGRVIVFTRTKRGADRVVRRLENAGLAAAAIHGNKSQNQRERALDAFRKGKCQTLVATDIAARGIDVPGIELVINFELPNVPEVYVHRIGRTARAGAEGRAVAFCDPDERAYLRDIQKLIKIEIPILDGPDGIETFGNPDLTHAKPPKVKQQQRPPRHNRPPRSDKPTANNGPGGKPRRNRRPGKRPAAANS